MPRAAHVAPMPLGEPPAPPTPQLRVGGLLGRARKLAPRGGRGRVRFPRQAAPAQRITQAPILQRRAAEQQAAAQGKAAAKAAQRTSQPGIVRAAVTGRIQGANDARARIAADAAADKRAARRKAQAATPATTPPRAAPPTQRLGAPVTTRLPTAPPTRPIVQTPPQRVGPAAGPPTPRAPRATRPLMRGHVTNPRGQPVGHLLGPATNAPAEPQPEQSRISRFFGRGAIDAPAPRAAKPARAIPAPRAAKPAKGQPPAPPALPAPPPTLEQQRAAIQAQQTPPTPSAPSAPSAPPAPAPTPVGEAPPAPAPTPVGEAPGAKGRIARIAAAIRRRVLREMNDEVHRAARKRIAAGHAERMQLLREQMAVDRERPERAWGTYFRERDKETEHADRSENG